MSAAAGLPIAIEGVHVPPKEEEEHAGNKAVAKDQPKAALKELTKE